MTNHDFALWEHEIRTDPDVDLPKRTNWKNIALFLVLFSWLVAFWLGLIFFMVKGMQ